jgi:hypothetical protein
MFLKNVDNIIHGITTQKTTVDILLPWELLISKEHFVGLSKLAFKRLMRLLTPSFFPY